MSQRTRRHGGSRYPLIFAVLGIGFATLPFLLPDDPAPDEHDDAGPPTDAGRPAAASPDAATPPARFVEWRVEGRVADPDMEALRVCLPSRGVERAVILGDGARTTVARAGIPGLATVVRAPAEGGAPGDLVIRTPVGENRYIALLVHLALGACLQEDAVALVDATLRRRSTPGDWPDTGNGLTVEPFFTVYAAERAAYTEGMARLGLPELALRLDRDDQLARARQLLQQVIATVVSRGVPEASDGGLELLDGRQVRLWAPDRLTTPGDWPATLRGRDDVRFVLDAKAEASPSLTPPRKARVRRPPAPDSKDAQPRRRGPPRTITEVPPPPERPATRKFMPDYR
jgi:hypothetical protein